mmetsp:Transcript_52883/g.60028  ORF Transcript_52883/g.60028 Transcript_52883/m.60028 type:complete len:642 (+) Transcript_52883:361-2286(+)
MVAVVAIIPTLFVVPLFSSSTGGGTSKTRRGNKKGSIRPQSSSSYRSLRHGQRLRDDLSNTQSQTTLIQGDCDIVKENHEELLDDHPFLIDEEYELKDEEKDQLRFLIQQRKSVESLLASVIDNDQGRPSPYDPPYPASTVVTGRGGERHSHSHSTTGGVDLDLTHSFQEAFDRYKDDNDSRPSFSPSSYPDTSTSTLDTPTILIPPSGYDHWNENDKNSILISQENTVVVPPILIRSSPSSVTTTTADTKPAAVTAVVDDSSTISKERFLMERIIENIQRRSDDGAGVVIQPPPRQHVLVPSTSSSSSMIATTTAEVAQDRSRLRNTILINNNGRKSKIQKFAKAGVKDHFRIIHSLVGLSSIVIGLHHMMEVLIFSSFTLADLSIATIIGTGLVHTCTGLFGIRRLNFHNPKEAARNAMFWPAPIQGLWLASVSLTEWGQGSNALVSMWQTPFVAFTAFNIVLTCWQLSQILTKTGTAERTKDTIWFQKAQHNAILVEFSYLFWMQLQMGTVLYLATMGPGSQAAFTAFMDTYPKMQLLLSNLALNTAFFNNLAIFLATLLRYKILRKPTTASRLSSSSTTTTTTTGSSTTMTSLLQDNKVVFSLPLFSSIFIVWKVLSCFFFSYEGSMSSSFISLIFQ